MIKPVKLTQLNVSAVLNDLDNPAKQKTIQRVAVLAGARSLLESIRQSVITNVSKSTIPNPKYKDTLVDAVLMSKERTDGSRIVHAYGTREPKSGTYRLRFFNKDTKERYQKTFNGKKLKKKRFLSHITGTDFFNRGYQSGRSAAENAMKNAILKLIET